MTKRVDWIDVAKGLGAILVLWGHFVMWEEPKIFIYAFHMPMFFFLAGITFQIKKDDSSWTYIKKKFISIMIPSYFFGGILFIYRSLYGFIDHENKWNILKRFIGILVCIRDSEYNCNIWFLPCFFYVLLMMYFLEKKIKGNILRAVIVVGIFILGYWMALEKIILPFYLDISFIALAFVYSGNILKKYIEKINKFAIILFIPMIVGSYYNYCNSKNIIEMSSNRYNNFLLFLVVAYLGIFAMIGLSKIIKNNTFLKQVGKNSMYLYGAQMSILGFYNAVMYKFLVGKISKIQEIILSILATGIIFIFLWMIKKYYYFLFEKISTKLNK